MDAVIAWVDGSDPAHAEKRRRFAGEASHAGAREPTRWGDRGEVLWALGSLLRFAPFLRRVHVVTDDQRPPDLGRFAHAGLCAPDAIRVVDHREVFAGLPAALPTFNSLSIEAVLWRVPGLGEEFVYLNDDFLLLRPHGPEDFFRDGRPVLRGAWASLPVLRAKLALRAALRRVTGRPPTSRPNFRLTQALGARLAGEERRFLRFGHHPHPMRRSLLEAFFAERPEVLAAQVGHRFRSRSQFSTVALANHLALRGPGAVVLPPAGELVVDFSKGGRRDASALVRGARQASACIQSLDMAPEAEAEALARAVAERLGPALPQRLSRA